MLRTIIVGMIAMISLWVGPQAAATVDAGNSATFTYDWNPRAEGADPKFTTDSVHDDNISFFVEGAGFASFAIVEGTGTIQWHFQTADGAQFNNDVTITANSAIFTTGEGNFITGEWSIDGLNYTQFYNHTPASDDEIGFVANAVSLAQTQYPGGRNLFVRFTMHRQAGNAIAVQLLRSADSSTTGFLVTGSVISGALVPGDTTTTGPLTFRTVAITGQAAPGTQDGVTFVDFGGYGAEPPAINNDGQTAFLAIVAGPGVDSSNQNGLWSEGTGALALVARDGSHAPGTPADVSFSLLGQPVINNDGQTAFDGSLSGTSVDPNINGHGIWIGDANTLTLVAREGSQAPGAADGVNFDRFQPYDGARPVLNDSGKTAFLASVTGAAVTSSNEFGIWSDAIGTLALLAGQGDQAPGTPQGVTFLILGKSAGGINPFQADETPVLNSNNQTAFLGVLFDPAAEFLPRQGIWSGTATTLAPVSLLNDPAPGATAGATFTGFRAPVINNAGQVAFPAFVGGTAVFQESGDNTGIWSQASGTLDLVVRAGSQAPGLETGVIFESTLPFSSELLVFNGAGQTAFPALLSGPGIDSSNNLSLWSEGSGSLALVAREGDQAPGTPLGTTFKQDNRFTPVLNGAGQTAFRAFLTGPDVNSDNDGGIWAEDPDGVLTLIVRDGDTIQVAPGDARTINYTDLILGAGGQDGRPTSFNDSGQLAFRATFTDGAEGIFVAGRFAQDAAVQDSPDDTETVSDSNPDDDCTTCPNETDTAQADPHSDSEAFDDDADDFDITLPALDLCGAGTAMLLPFAIAALGIIKSRPRRVA